jgi:hypothetical protein
MGMILVKMSSGRQCNLKFYDLDIQLCHNHHAVMNATGVSNDTIGAGWYITFSYCFSREDPVERCSFVMTSVSQLSDLTVLRSAVRLRADHLLSEPIQQAKRSPVSLALTETAPLISETKPISQIPPATIDVASDRCFFREFPIGHLLAGRCWDAIFCRSSDLICRIYLLPRPT